MNQAMEHIMDVRREVLGLPVFIAGSAVAAAMYAPHTKGTEYDDIDIFCSSSNSLIAAAERLRNDGYSISERFERVYHRWLKYGMGTWHTNSLTLEHEMSGLKVNLVYKLVNKAPVSSLAQVIESFDFGLLAIGGWDCEYGSYHDMRSYFFPKEVAMGTTLIGANMPLPMLPSKAQAWRDGFVSQYNGLREATRYIKYLDYGYNMDLVRDDLLAGYTQVAKYMSERDQPDKQMLADIYLSLAQAIENDDRDKLRAFGKELPYMDSLQQMLDNLE